jgi:hypothetical protein
MADPVLDDEAKDFHQGIDFQNSNWALTCVTKAQTLGCNFRGLSVARREHCKSAAKGRAGVEMRRRLNSLDYHRSNISELRRKRRSARQDTETEASLVSRYT